MIKFFTSIIVVLAAQSLSAGESWRFHQSENPFPLQREAGTITTYGLTDYTSDQLNYAPAGAGFGATYEEFDRLFGVIDLSDGGSVCVPMQRERDTCLLTLRRDELMLLDRQTRGSFPIRFKFSLKP